MTEEKDGGSAFPRLEMLYEDSGDFMASNTEGMSLRQYAAIHLKIPNSGTDWLDEMIRKSGDQDHEKITSSRTDWDATIKQFIAGAGK